MKQLTCEMCGSTDLIKDGGVFVCQSCGCKYSVEEARKMMVEGTVDVRGTVAIDRSSEFARILKNADATFDDGNYEEAFALYSQVLNINPEEPHAILWRALSSAWQSTVTDCRIVEMDKAEKRSIQLLREQVGISKEYFDFCNRAIAQISSVTNAVSQMYIRYHNKAMPVNLSLTSIIATAGITQEIISTMHTGTKNCCTIMLNAVFYMIDEIDDFSEADERFWNNLETLLENAQAYRENADMTPDPALSHKLDEVKGRHDEWIKARQELYLKDNPEKDAEMQSLAAKRADVLQQIDSKNNEIATLTKKRNSLGLFAGSEKKAIDAQINAIKGEIASLEADLKKQCEDKNALLAEALA